MQDKLIAIEKRFGELEAKLQDPESYQDPELLRRLTREQKELEPVARKYRALQKLEEELRADGELLCTEEDPELRSLLKEELEGGREKLSALEEELKLLLLPRDPDDDRNVIMEIRAGAGGDEAALFAHSLYRMYAMYAEKSGWKLELSSLSETELGGVKEVIFRVEGAGAYARLKFESGVHRVQRVPDTETQGRIHTSTVTVAVLPELEDVEFELDPNDLRIDVFRSSGAGGQKVNKTSSAIRVTHLPTGMVVECQDERSQYKNKDRALSILRSRLYEIEKEKQRAGVAAERKSQVGTGMRNERIRTYNFPQGRVTDHRIGLTLYKIDAVMNGDLEELVSALRAAEQAEKLKSSAEDQV